mgnify:FL=1
MCGVCGIVSLREPLPLGPRCANAMVEALAHRGPDASRVTTVERAALGATRLAIRGLESGTQPIVDAETGVTAVCNGEIDNHRELREWLASRGRSVHLATDVAVIPGLYLEKGDEFVEHLRGEFAVAIWDPRRPRLVLARDRAGERPLFFVQHDDTIRFATEIAALATDDSLALTVDREMLRAYLQFGSFAAPRSPFREVQKIGRAHV